MPGLHPARGLCHTQERTPAHRAAPETDRKLLYANKAYTSRIPQVSPQESRALLDMLFDAIACRPVLHCRVHWTPAPWCSGTTAASSTTRSTTTTPTRGTGSGSPSTGPVKG
ncbi:TauD/TfdA family dioxygenase [Streptomyces sp. M10(2022)]